MTSARILIGTAVLAGSAALLAGCGTSTPAASPMTSGPAATTPATSPSSPARPAASPTAAPSSQPAASVAACATSALHVAVSNRGSAAAGSAFYPIQFRNTSGSPCTLYGYPGVSFVGTVGGGQIGAAATRDISFPAKQISLSPGQTVHATLQIGDAVNYPSGDCGLVTAHWLKIYPPNQTAPVYVSFTARTCSKPKPILSVQAVQSGSSGS